MSVVRLLKRNEVLYKAGQSADAVFLIEKGKFEVDLGDRTETYEAGEVLGAFDCLLSRNYSKTVRAVSSAKVKAISKHEQIMQLEGSVSLRMLISLLTKLDSESPNRWT